MYKKYKNTYLIISITNKLNLEKKRMNNEEKACRYLDRYNAGV